MKRSRNRIAALGIFAVLGSGLIKASIGGGYDDYVEDRLGEQYISQECAPRQTRRRRATVTGVDLTCDSQLDDDSASYTNNLSCKPGDLARVAISFELRKWSRSTDIYIDLNSTALGKSQRVYKNSDLCQMRNLAYWGDEEARDVGDDLYAHAKSSICPPRNGPYTLFTSFTLPSYSKSSDHDFVPDLRIKFFDEDRTLVGCVETGNLAEISFNKAKERKGQEFFVLSILLLCLVSTLCIIGHGRRRRKGRQAIMKKQNSMLRRFHYVQTNRNGDFSNPSVSASRSFGSSTTGSRLPSFPTIPEVN